MLGSREACYWGRGRKRCEGDFLEDCGGFLWEARRLSLGGAGEARL